MECSKFARRDMSVVIHIGDDVGHEIWIDIHRRSSRGDICVVGKGITSPMSVLIELGCPSIWEVLSLVGSDDILKQSGYLWPVKLIVIRCACRRDDGSTRCRLFRNMSGCMQDTFLEMLRFTDWGSWGPSRGRGRIATWPASTLAPGAPWLLAVASRF